MECRGDVTRLPMSRTANVTKNLTVGVISKVFLLGATFVVRTLFIRILGAEYTGISSLYSNILSLLNLAELGFGSVLTYELYKPLKDNDEETVAALVALFKKIYTAVIVVVLTFGLLLIPLLKYIVKSDLNQSELLIYYVLYLMDSVASYFVAYRTMVIEADQKYYVTNLAEIIAKFAMYICQSIYLVLTRDFLGYLIIQVAFTILKNIALHIVSLRMYPYLSRKNTACRTNIATGRIYKNVKAMCVTKISGVILNQTDSIIISMLLGTVYVGYYSNYYMLIVYVNSIYNIVVTSIEASIGNLNAEADSEKSYAVYKRLSFLMACMNTVCVTIFLCVVQDFISVWIGTEYQQSMLLIVALLSTFYLQQSMSIVYIYRQTLGLFESVKKAYPVMAMFNILFSILFGKIVGVAGVAFATGFSRLLTVFWYEGKVVFTSLKHKVGEYLADQFAAMAVTIVIAGVAYAIVGLIPFHGVMGLVSKGTVALTCSMIMLWVSYHQKDEWKWMTAFVQSNIRTKLHL